MQGGFLYEVTTNQKSYLVVSKIKNVAVALTTFEKVFGFGEDVECVEFINSVDAVME